MSVNYKPGSLVSDFSVKEMESIKKMWRLDFPEFEFDPVYVRHIQRFNGGNPVEKYFATKAGKCLPIDRFLNSGDLDLLSDRTLKDLNVNVIWSLISDRLNIYLLPFAAVANGDFLCFDYENGFPPSVVLWVQELSEEDEPHVEPVADTFQAFLDGLTETFQE